MNRLISKSAAVKHFVDNAPTSDAFRAAAIAVHSARNALASKFQGRNTVMMPAHGPVQKQKKTTVVYVPTARSVSTVQKKGSQPVVDESSFQGPRDVRFTGNTGGRPDHLDDK